MLKVQNLENLKVRKKIWKARLLIHKLFYLQNPGMGLTLGSSSAHLRLTQRLTTHSLGLASSTSIFSSEAFSSVFSPSAAAGASAAASVFASSFFSSKLLNIYQWKLIIICENVKTFYMLFKIRKTWFAKFKLSNHKTWESDFKFSYNHYNVLEGLVISDSINAPIVAKCPKFR